MTVKDARKHDIYVTYRGGGILQPENKIDLLIIPLCVIKTSTLCLFIRETKDRRNNLHFCFYIQMPTLL